MGAHKHETDFEVKFCPFLKNAYDPLNTGEEKVNHSSNQEWSSEDPGRDSRHEDQAGAGQEDDPQVPGGDQEGSEGEGCRADNVLMRISQVF